MMIFAVTRETRAKENTESRKSEGGEGGAKNSDGRQTPDKPSSDVKPGRAGLVLGWVTTFKQKPLC